MNNDSEPANTISTEELDGLRAQLPKKPKTMKDRALVRNLTLRRQLKKIVDTCAEIGRK